nr:hypothetical protein [Tanacetum cinerariifolium]
MPLPIFTPLPTSSFPLPLSLPSTSGSESIPEAYIPLRKRARFTTPTGRYEKMTPKRTTRSTQVPPVTPASTATTTTVTKAQLQALIDQGVVAAMAEEEACRVRNGYGSNGHCPPRCNNCKRVGHLTRDCRSRPANANNNNNTNNNNRNNNNNNNNQKGNGCYECGAQGHFKRNCPKLRNNNRDNQSENDNAQARVYVIGNAGANPDNVVADD